MHNINVKTPGVDMSDLNLLVKISEKYFFLQVCLFLRVCLYIAYIKE